MTVLKQNELPLNSNLDHLIRNRVIDRFGQMSEVEKFQFFIRENPSSKVYFRMTMRFADQDLYASTEADNLKDAVDCVCARLFEQLRDTYLYEKYIQ